MRSQQDLGFDEGEWAPAADALESFGDCRLARVQQSCAQQLGPGLAETALFAVDDAEQKRRQPRLVFAALGPQQPGAGYAIFALVERDRAGDHVDLRIERHQAGRRAQLAVGECRLRWPDGDRLLNSACGEERDRQRHQRAGSQHCGSRPPRDCDHAPTLARDRRRRAGPLPERRRRAEERQGGNAQHRVLPKPVDRPVHEPHDQRQQQYPPGHTLRARAPAAQGADEGREHEQREQHRSDESGVDEQAQLDRMQPARPAASAAASATPAAILLARRWADRLSLTRRSSATASAAMTLSATSAISIARTAWLPCWCNTWLRRGWVRGVPPGEARPYSRSSTGAIAAVAAAGRSANANRRRRPGTSSSISASTIGAVNSQPRLSLRTASCRQTVATSSPPTRSAAVPLRWALSATAVTAAVMNSAASAL